MAPWSQQPFFQVALPIIVTFILATWYQASRITDLRETIGKRIDDLRSEMNARFADMNARFADVNARLTSIETRLGALDVKVEALQMRAFR